MSGRVPAPLLRVCLLALAASLAGCATYGEGGGIRTWQAEPAERVLGHRPPHARIQVVTERASYLLEGARLEADSVIGFRQLHRRWERVALPLDAAERLEVKKLNVELSALLAGAGAALGVAGLIYGQ